MTAKPISNYQKFFYVGILVLAAIFSLLIIEPYISVLALTAVAAIILHPVYEWLVRRMKNFRALAALVTIFILIVVVAAILFFVGSKVFDEAVHLYTSLKLGTGNYQTFVTGIQTKINSYLPAEFAININSYLSAAAAWIVSHFGVFFSNTLSSVLKVFLSAIALFYMLKDGPRMVTSIEKASPLPKEHTEIISAAFVRSVRTILLGSLAIAVIQGTFATIGFLIFSVPNPFLIGLITGLSALLPAIGTSIIVAPTVIFLFVTGHTTAAIGLAIWEIIFISIIDNIVSPKFIERGVKVHPLIILFSVLGGLSFFGPEGFLLGPLVLSLLFTLLEMYHVFINFDK